ncbi:MAG: UDP-N-acetylmuramoyl-L-alanine--D-glutamate ligase [Actinomycetota bacterium]|nr:UDP-N-acetylmuramoyl-L-alanine--D-glutamate ligase [Actinomycetota bacterium]
MSEPAGRSGEDRWAGRRVLVVGLGTSGYAAAHALLGLGAVVRVTEAVAGPLAETRAKALRQAGAAVELGGHDLTGLDADLAIMSPGVAPHSTVASALRLSGTEVWSEIELAYRLARCEFLAVTGTNGKTTTTSLLAAMLDEGGIPSTAAGNIGRPLVEAVVTLPENGAVAVEVSSFQLASIDRFRPRVSVVLNVAEDHTDWHGTFGQYAAAKGRIVANQQPEDVYLPNLADDVAMDIARRAAARVVPFSAESAPGNGIGVDAGRVCWRGRTVFSCDDIPLPGRAGLEDTVAAAGAALAYGVDPVAVVRAIEGFRAPPHRLEAIAEQDGVTYIDDSKATNPHATLTAVKGLDNVVLIAGGRSKGIDLSVLAQTAPPVIAVVAMGEAAPEIVRTFEGLVPVKQAPNMVHAVRLAREHARSPGSVLLSPGCASLDMYDNYARRGDHFSQAVRASLDGDPKDPKQGRENG